ncbi:class I SAM-dependent methyltransferase [Actinoplanes sp. TRM 88003]|uniref:Class I SAM-dependent methyltransferase n=1 Tax=Paractinoplanes aksuensis TaxID=2939490 RepID=A0ABT1DVA0_9ACTN|nr:methyltransferase domain-containing protein [Actinoplanes aksuensis]MCO8274794.1 class I SAM-dependent methyltransferase [Actinoplanes aksuensis]
MADSVIKLFDRVADTYDDVLPFFANFGLLTAERLPEPAPGRRLLDIGSGRGAIAIPARRRGYEVTAADAAPAMVARLQQEQPALDVRLMDAARLDLPDDSFDVVTAGLVMHIVDDPAAVTREVHRVLRPGGLFVFTTPGQVPEGFEFADGANALFGEFAQYLPPRGSMGAPFDEIETLTAAGFDHVSETDLRLELPMADAETLWRWFQTHGTRKYFDDLPAERRAEFHRRLLADLAGRGPLVLRRYAWLHEARKSN